LGVLLPLRISIRNRTVLNMKDIEIDEKVERHLSTNEKLGYKPLNLEPKGTVIIGGEYVTLRYERRLSHPRRSLEGNYRSERASRMDEYQSTHRRT
jgi:hypothetical protein